MLLLATMVVLPATALGVDLPPPTSSAPAPAPSAPPPSTGESAPPPAAPAPAPVVAVQPVRLKLGSRGPVVRDLQRELRRRGARIAVDGVFGQGTRRAVIRQQNRLRLRPTGVADAVLLRRLGIQVSRVASLRLSVGVPAGVRMTMWPTSGRFESPFGPRWGRIHEGIDISNETGTPVKAALSGIVSFAGNEGGYGNMVKLDHGDGLETRYAHLSTMQVVEGQYVAAGHVLGGMGGTGSVTGIHLHFEVRVGGIAYDPLTALPPRPRSVLPGL
jgi:murein DD-endopeptidase MepM/ murein hydrolase activator NlpD